MAADKAKTQASSSQYVKEYTRLLETHSLPISRMGDIDWYVRLKLGVDLEDETRPQPVLIQFYLRNPSLSDDENLQLHRIYCGNPFIAPGHIGAKTKRAFMQTAGELVADEYFEEHDESVIPSLIQPTPVVQMALVTQRTPEKSESTKEPSPAKETVRATAKRKNYLEEMEQQAQSVLLRYRALNQKPSELRHMVLLPIKRDRSTADSSQYLIQGLSPAQVSEVVHQLLAYVSTSPQQSAVQLKSLEATLGAQKQQLSEGERKEL